MTDQTRVAGQDRIDLGSDNRELVLDARNLAVTFKVEGGTVEAVRDMNFQVHRGETVAIVGESGSGKSVTARCIMRLLSKRATISKTTRITLAGQDILSLPEPSMRKIRGNKVSMIFQEPMSSLNPVYTVGTQIIEVLRLHNRISRTEARDRALALLREVQIPDPESRLRNYPHQLSGGQRQRVMIAIALANRPELLIADEPTTALDVTVQAQILTLLRDLKDSHGMSVVLITHDLTIVEKFSQYVYVMQHGRVCEHGPTTELFSRPRHAYTQRLLASEPKGVAQPFDGTGAPVLQGDNVRVAFTLKKGTFFKPVYTPLVAVDNLDIAVRRSETLGIVGESGSGKTTFGQALLRLIPCQSGEISFDGAAHRRPRPQGAPPLPLPHADRLPGPLLLAQPAPEHPRPPRGRPHRQRHRLGRERPPGPHQGRPRRRRHARQHPAALPARILRRPAPAHRHRPRHRPRTGVHPARRTHVGP